MIACGQGMCGFLCGCLRVVGTFWGGYEINGGKYR